MTEVNIIFLVLPHIHLLDLAGPDQVMHEAIEYGVNIKIEYCGISANTKTSSLLPIGSLKHFSKMKLNEGDYIIIPGAEVSYLLSKEMAAEKELMQWLKKSYQSKVNLCSICTGAFLLAVAGLLDNRKCTTHWKRTSELQKKFPKLNVIENILYTEQDGLYTSAGVTAGIDLALHIVGKLTNDRIAYKIARELVVYIRRQGNDSQRSVFLNYRNHIHSGIHIVQDWLQSNLNRKSNIEHLAELANMSPRNLTRVFKKETGTTVHEYITAIRLEKIRALTQDPDLSRKQIAQQVGLESEKQLTRLLKM